MEKRAAVELGKRVVSGTMPWECEEADRENGEKRVRGVEVDEEGLNLSDFARGNEGVGLGERFGLGALVIVRAAVLVSVSVVRAEGLSAVAFNGGETEALFAARSGTNVALFAEESSRLAERSRRRSRAWAWAVDIHH